jgi:hypothetical protein
MSKPGETGDRTEGRRAEGDKTNGDTLIRVFFWLG